MRQIFWNGYLALSALAFFALMFLGAAYFYNHYLAEYRTVLPAYRDGQAEAHARNQSDVSVENFALVPFIESEDAFNPSPANIDAIRRGGIDYVTKNEALIERVITALEPKG